MNDIELLTAFFGWCVVLSLGIYVLSVTVLWLMRGFVVRMNALVFGIAEEEVANVMFRYITLYKLAMTVFFFTPWLALKIIG